MKKKPDNAIKHTHKRLYFNHVKEIYELMNSQSEVYELDANEYHLDSIDEIALGENPLVIRDRLGHEEIETTLGTYGHLYPNTNYEVASKLDGIISVRDNSNKTTLTRNQFTSKLT